MESKGDANCDLSEHHSQIIINFVTLLKLHGTFSENKNGRNGLKKPI